MRDGEQSLAGAYGPWLAAHTLGDDPPARSLRRGRPADLEAWRRETRAEVLARLNPPDLGCAPTVTVTAEGERDGLLIQELTWPQPAGEPTQAVLLKPAGATGPLPGVLGLHCHGGNKFLGWRKIADGFDPPWAYQLACRAYYDDVAWANQLARRGFVVLVHDTFTFASRRIRWGDVPTHAVPAAFPGCDPPADDLAGIASYNGWAAQLEHLLAKVLLSAGTTYAGCCLAEDRVALDILASQPEVDPTRLGCGGLSGGGLRTVYLAGLDERIACAACVGFMSTWRDFLLGKAHTHTWMLYAPGVPPLLDFPEVLGLRAPLPTLVQSCTEDPLYTLPEMERANAMLAEVFELTGGGDRFAARLYPGGHQFNSPMQQDAFAWFERWLG